MAARNRTRAALIAGAVTAALVVAPTALATFPGDNGVIAYSKGGDIYTVHSDGTGEHQLTSGAAVDGSPEWAPDGASMLFTRDGGVWRMKADGTGAAKVIDQGDYPQISADGKSFIYLSPLGFNGSVRGANLDGSGDHLVYENNSFTVGTLDDWAPTHSLFGLTFFDDDDQLGLLSPTGARVQGYVLNDERQLDNISPAFSPDGSKIAFQRRYSAISVCSGGPCAPDPDIGIATMDIGGGGLKTIHSDNAHLPAWSPDGQRIAFIAGGDVFSGGALQWVYADGSGKKTLAQGANSPDWQPISKPTPNDSKPLEKIVTVPGPTVTVQVPGPVRVVEKVVTRTVTASGEVCPIPKGTRLTLTLRATRAIKKGAKVRVQVDPSGKARILGRKVGVRIGVQ